MPQGEAGIDSLVDGSERHIGSKGFGLAERDRRRHPDGGIEQDGAVEPSRAARRQLEQEPASEAVPDPEASSRRDALQQVRDVLLERPRRLPPGVPMAAEIRGQNMEPPGKAISREPCEPCAVPGHTMHANDRRASGIPPLVHMEPQLDPRSFIALTPASGVIGCALRRVASASLRATPVRVDTVLASDITGLGRASRR